MSDATDQDLPLLDTPSHGLPEVIDTLAGLESARAALLGAGGPIAVDAERASGFRYDQRAFLIQLRRGDAPVILIDPERIRLEAGAPALASLRDVLTGPEWILHAAHEDLPSLRATGVAPSTLFDTERAARLLGYERFGLAAVVARTLGVRLAKEHSAVDWSTRPLPEAWLSYAALDVEVLVAVRDVLAAELAAHGRDEWAAQEFAHLRDVVPSKRVDPWRRVSGAGTLRQPRELAIVKSLWEARDALAKSLDLAPGKVLGDRVIVAWAAKGPQSPAEAAKMAGRSMSMADAKRWYQAIRTARALPNSALPSRKGPGRGNRRRSPEERDVIKERTALLRARIAAQAEGLGIDHDILVQPAIVRELADTPPQVPDRDSIAEFLSARGARPWQVDLTAPTLAEALSGA